VRLRLMETHWDWQKEISRDWLRATQMPTERQMLKEKRWGIPTERQKDLQREKRLGLQKHWQTPQLMGWLKD